MNFFSLENRAARCVRNANQGDATCLMVTAAEREEAQRLVGGSPVIVATGFEIRNFLIHLDAETSSRRRRR
jgi:hypothetical protein